MELKFKVVKNTIIVEESPKVLTKKDVNKFINMADFDKVVLCEGIEEIAEDAFSFCCSMKSIVLPNSLKVINNQAFIYSGIEEIVVPENVVFIGKSAFKWCSDLKKVVILNGLRKIDALGFHGCVNLEEIALPDSLIYLGEHTFNQCYNLKSIIIPKNINKIRRQTFFGCSSLKEVTLSKNVKSIGISAFERCGVLEKIENLENVEEIFASAFYSCNKLREFNLGNNLKKIDSRSFAFCSEIHSLVIPDSVEKIGSEAFYGCSSLNSIKLSKKIKVIENNTFYHCVSLKEIILFDEIEEIREKAFYYCKDLKEIKLPKNLKKIGKQAFEDCHCLTVVDIPEGIKEIPEYLFYHCYNLETVKLPSTLENISMNFVDECENFEKIVLNTADGEVEIGINGHVFIRNNDNKLFLFNYRNNNYYLYNNGRFIVFNSDIFKQNSKVSLMIKNCELKEEDYARLYYYSKKKFIPSPLVVKNLPIDDIDNFYVNNNAKKWAELIKMYNSLISEEGKASFFKLCYVLGLFDVNSSNRDLAYDFIKNNIIEKLHEEDIHAKFDGFDLNNSFNKEYAEFFMRYYDEKFMIYRDEFGQEIDLTAASYNNFKNVKFLYPNKVLNTNRKSDLLLPIHVIDAVRSVFYNNIDNGNESFSVTVGQYGYSQEQFEKLQKFYNIGKKIAKEDMELFIKEDDEENCITYSLLDKGDPICAILGNITNCCQIVGGAGESCVEYGMTMPNSGFITFNYNGTIIGQSWIWYDKETFTVCLDNIEVPRRYCEKVKSNKNIQSSFIDCLIRLKDNIVKEMNKNGLKVDKVTVGKGYNDIGEILNKEFKLVKYCSMLEGYCGYSDAIEQYEIYKPNKLMSNKKI